MTPSPRAGPHVLQPLAIAVALVLGAAWAQGVGLVGSPLEPRIEAEPGEVVTVRLRLESMGADAWSAEPTVSAPPDWVVVVPAGTVTLEPYRPRVVLLSVRVPAAAGAGVHPVRVEVHDRRTGRTHAFDASVVVPEVRRASLTIVHAPPLVHDNAFTHRYLLRNDGNGDAKWLLSVRAGASLGARVEPEQVTLAPGEAVEVVVALSVPRTLERTTRIVITLTAQHANDDETRASARGTTEVVPPVPAGGGLMHTLPLVLRVTASARLGAGTDTPTFELRGSGPLSDHRLDNLSVHYRAPIEDPLAPDAMLLNYQREGWSVRAGLLSLARGDHLDGVTEYGVGAAVGWEATEDWRLHVDVAAAAGATPALAATFTAAHAPGLQLEAATFLVPGEALARFGVEHRARRDASAPLSVTRAHASYTVRAQHDGADGVGEDAVGWTIGHLTVGGVRIQGAAVHGSLEQSFRSAGFDGRERHLAATTARLGVRVDRLVGDDAWPRIDATVSYHLTLRWPATRPSTDDALPNPPAGLAARNSVHRLEVRAHVVLDNLSVSLARTETWAQPADVQERRSTTVTDLSVRLGASIAVGQRLTWLQAHGAASDRLDYRATAALPTSGTGRLRVQLDLGYVLDPGRLDTMRVQGTWTGTVTPTVRLNVGASLRPLDDRRTIEAAASATFALGGGHALDLGLGLELHRAAPLGVSASVGYTMPLDVSVSRRTTVGTVHGRLLGGGLAPIAGAMVQIAGHSAITRADGSFTVTAVPSGAQSVHVPRETLPFDYPVRSPDSPTNVDVVAGETLEVELTYLAGAAVEGHILVVDAGGEALGERVVGPTTDAEQWLGGALVAASNGSESIRAVTSPGGTFRLTYLLPGTWTVTMHHPALPSDFRLGPTSVTIEVEPGATASIAFELHPVRRTLRIQDGGALVPALSPPPSSPPNGKPGE